MASKISRLSKAIAIAMLGLSLSGGNMPAVHASDADAELAALEAELAALESELAQEKGTIKEEKTKLKNEPNKLKLSGDARIKYVHSGTGARWYERGRIAMQHDINDKVSVYARWGLMNDNPMGLSEHNNHRINTFSSKKYNEGYIPAKVIYPDLEATDGSWVSDANMQVKKLLGADKFTLGRFGQTFGATGLLGDEDAFGGIDGAKFDWSGQAGALTVGYAKFGATQQYPEINSTQALNSSYGIKYLGGAYQRKAVEQALFVNGQLKLGPAVTLHGMWIKEMNNGKSKLIETGSIYSPYFYDNPDDHDIRGIGITAQITPTLKVVGDYVINACDQSAYLADNIAATTTKEDTNPNKGNAIVNAAKTKYKKFDFGRQKSTYVSLRYKEAKWGDKGSFGINLDWRNIDPTARLDAYFTYADNIGSSTINNEFYVSNSSLYNTLSVADDILVSAGIKGPVLGFNYMITKNVKLSVLQTFAGSYNWYQFNESPNKEKVSNKKWTYNFDANYNKVNEKADNMTVIALTAKF